MFEEIIRLINYIGEKHQEFSTKFYLTHKPINLKRVTVYKVMDGNSYDDVFISLLDAYIEELVTAQILYVFQTDHPLIETRFRGKNRESTLNKLYHYRFSKEDSNIPIQKTLNDLLGFRILLAKDVDYDQLLEEIEQTSLLEVKIFRAYVRRDKDYNAIHLYLKSNNNQFFPWELQIWMKSDEKSNEESHRAHKEKRKYINWTEIYKENIYKEND